MITKIKENKNVRYLTKVILPLALSVISIESLYLCFGYCQSNLTQHNQQTRYEFEVASVREVSSDSIMKSSLMFSGNQFIAEGQPLRNLILYAYNVPDYMVQWGKFEKIADRTFTIRAVIDDNLSSRLKQMTDEHSQSVKRILVQNLLSSRFGLAVHNGHKDYQGYILSTSKTGIKFTLSPPNYQQATTEDNAPQLRITKLGELHAEKIDFASFVNFLSGELCLPIVDKTGLNGDATFDLRWAQKPTALLKLLPSGASAQYKISRDDSDIDAPPLATALHEQLGLQVKREKVLGSLLVVDQISEPTEN
jgi:uncharacterized protein (TIGR03435 family)